MSEIQILLLYGIVHTASILYIFNMFDYHGYIPDEIEKITVYIFAPVILLMTLIRGIGGTK